jgi:hypothetical protein
MCSKLTKNIFSSFTHFKFVSAYTQYILLDRANTRNLLTFIVKYNLFYWEISKKMTVNIDVLRLMF